MTLFTFKDLRGDIVWSTANGSLSFTIELKLGGEPKISDLDFHFVVQEKITKFEISMNDSVGVKILNGVANLDDITLDLQLVKSSSSSQKFVQ